MNRDFALTNSYTGPANETMTVAGFLKIRNNEETRERKLYDDALFKVMTRPRDDGRAQSTTVIMFVPGRWLLIFPRYAMTDTSGVYTCLRGILPTRQIFRRNALSS